MLSKGRLCAELIEKKKLVQEWVNCHRKLQSQPTRDLFIYLLFTSRSTARVILRWVVYRWRKPVHTAL